MLKKIGYKSEPKLKIHKYVVAVSYRHKKHTHTKFHYCKNLKEVKAVAKSCKKGSWVDVFKAEHNFIQAYAQE